VFARGVLDGQVALVTGGGTNLGKAAASELARCGASVLIDARDVRAAFEQAMRPAGSGMIVNVTVSPHHGMPAMAHTGAARAAVEALTRELALEWAPAGVSVAALAIGRFLDRVAARVPRRAMAQRGRDRAAAAARGGRGVRLARGTARLPGGQSVVRTGPHARRRTRQLVRALATGSPGSGRGRADRGAAPSGLTVERWVPSRLPAGEVLWLHRSLPSF
jgi:NAD(P)-dependent dehydrogenase (short-subunit alcohol dehydrogenase family)